MATVDANLKRLAPDEKDAVPLGVADRRDDAKVNLKRLTPDEEDAVPLGVANRRDHAEPRIRFTPILITLLADSVAGVLGWESWEAYMGAPWTRDGTVRANVVTVAPEVAGLIVSLPVVANQFVHKGDILFEIDPAPFRIALEGAQAQLQRDTATLDYARGNEGRLSTLLREGWVSKNIYQQVTSTLRQLEGAVAVDKATIAKAEWDLGRAVVRSPVNGFVTNLLAQMGRYANVGRTIIPLVDADSYWVDGYFEETQLEQIQDGDPASIKPMGYSQILGGGLPVSPAASTFPTCSPTVPGLPR
jgi:multidrug resistance efflux pump